MPGKQEEVLKIRGTLEEVLRVAFSPAKKTAKPLPKKKRGRPKKGAK